MDSFQQDMRARLERAMVEASLAQMLKLASTTVRMAAQSEDAWLSDLGRRWSTSLGEFAVQVVCDRGGEMDDEAAQVVELRNKLLPMALLLK